MNTIDLIYAIAQGNAQEAQTAFEALVAERAAEAIEAKRIEVAQSMFKTPEDEVVEEQVEVIDELSSPTLKSYMDKGSKHMSKVEASRKDPENDKKYMKRYAGHTDALDRIVSKRKVSEEAEQIDEHVSHHDIDSAGHQHADLHNDYEKTSPGHGKRVADLEASIVVAHGPKALKSIQKNTELFHGYKAEENTRKTPMDKSEFLKKYGSKMEDHLQAARAASLEHQRALADKKPTQPRF